MYPSSEGATEAGIKALGTNVCVNAGACAGAGVCVTAGAGTEVRVDVGMSY